MADEALNQWLATADDQLRTETIERFDPRFWTVNFPRPAIASVVTTATDALQVDAQFHMANDLVGLIWESVDRHDHPLLSYETDRDYRGLVWRFRWRSSGQVLPLDALNGPTLTIEGRDATGAARSWFVRLWNYAAGTPTDAAITIDFDALAGGFLLPAEAQPVWAGDIDRLFISLVGTGYTGAAARLASPQTGLAAISDMRCAGARSTLAAGDACLPPHGVRMANGYDDVYNVTPARVLRTMLQLGYRGRVDHYVGMSHFFRLAWSGAEGALLADAAAPVLNPACLSWHRNFCAGCKTLGYEPTFAISYELFDAHCPQGWKQRAHDDSPALTGWSPPSTLLAPTNAAAMAYARDVMLAFAGLAGAAGLPVRIQIGEPWWWSGLGASRKPCFYDATTLAAYPAETGQAVPARHRLATETPTAAQNAYLDWLATKLAQATSAQRAAVRAAWPGAEVSLLVYTPQIIDAAAPMLARANLPAAWASPAFERLQLEDYDHIVAGNRAAHDAGLNAALGRLGYPSARTDYFAGFVLNAGDNGIWRSIGWALEDAAARGFAERYVWAYPQVVRDGFTLFEPGGDMPLSDFHDIDFPFKVAAGAEVAREASTMVVETGSGREYRNANWENARARYDAGLGVRSEGDLAEVLRFFRARGGRAHAFRFRDPLDSSSAALGAGVTPADQPLGTGDGATLAFPLVKDYGDAAGARARRITRPVAGSVRVAVAGVERLTGWMLDTGGVVRFATAPTAGQSVTAGFLFDTPVRFDDDRLSVSLASFRAGEAPNIPLIEVRED